MRAWPLALLFLILSSGTTSANDTALIAAASSLRHVWPTLLDQLPADQTPRITFGSSGNLARQIAQGAPFDVLLSADESYPAWLNETGITNQQPITYAIGQLAWVARTDSPWAQVLSDALANETRIVNIADVKKLAIANPAFAPYGKAAQTVLNQLDNAKELSLTLGAVDGGIVPLALVTEQAQQKLPSIVVLPIPMNQHAPVVHSMVLTNDASNASREIVEFLQTDIARTVFEQHGFSVVR